MNFGAHKAITFVFKLFVYIELLELDELKMEFDHEL